MVQAPAAVPGGAGMRHLKVSQDPSWHEGVEGEWFRVPGVKIVPQPDPNPHVESSWSSSCSFPPLSAMAFLVIGKVFPSPGLLLVTKRGSWETGLWLADLPLYAAARKKRIRKGAVAPCFGSLSSADPRFGSWFYSTPLWKRADLMTIQISVQLFEQLDKSTGKYKTHVTCDRGLYYNNRSMHSSYSDIFKIPQK